MTDEKIFTPRRVPQGLLENLACIKPKLNGAGAFLNANGVRHDVDRIKSFRAIPYPTTAAELQQFLCAVNWMRESLVDFARQIAPLQKKLDEVLTRRRRTKRVAAGIKLSLTQEEYAAFDKVKAMLSNAATLEFPDDNATTCLFQMH
ncbi:unnamed protein product [Phytophthora lilii]|uniref:Unnamed protein product n=1 Tax=Phytophthora lilii TaxID=2077276 RepID=A0A9W6TTJ6_9STRA|nr:unnamed protein product [Phytophthora lilii]